MVRFLLYTALTLNFSALAVTAADRYEGWLLEQPRSSVHTLSFKQSVQLNNKIETSELGFICDQRKNLKSVGVILIPFDRTFQSDQEVIPVLIQKTPANTLILPTFCKNEKRLRIYLLGSER